MQAQSITHESTPHLERALSLRDLVLFNLVAVIGVGWVATAAKAGPSSLTLWVLAAALFFIPQGLAVVQLSSHYPDEGGIYAWTKRELGEGHGFLCGWCYWVNNVLYYPTLPLTGAVVATYIVGQEASGLANNWTYVLIFTMTCLVLAVVLNVIGVGTGKWLQNAGGIGVYIPGVILLLVGLYAAATRPSANPLVLSQLKPDLANLPVLNLWATIAFAYAGLELSSTMGHEIHAPQRSLPRSIYISAPLVALIYICGTASMLWIVPQNEINVTAGPLQGISNGVRNLGGAAAWLAPFAALCLTVSRLGGLGAWLTGSARVAFVIGLDRYFPAAFGRIHPRWHTPYVAILVQAPITAFFLFLSVLGKGTTVEAAFLNLIDMSLLIYFIPFIYLFVCFILHSVRRRTENPLIVPGGMIGAVIAGSCGVLITLFAMIMAIIPPPGTADVPMRETTVVGGPILLTGLGLIIYWLARRKAKI